MRIAQSDIQKFKIATHLLQALVIFIALCLTISVMVKDGEIGGATKYFFAMCFLSFPAIVYLVGVPMWTRARKFSSAYAFLAVDAVYMILWFAAFVAVAVWNSQGIIEGAKEKKVKDDDRDCKTFLYGSEAKCSQSKAAVGMGAVVFIFFIVSTAISSYYMFKYMREGAMPYESQEMDPHYTSGESAKDNAWSTEIEQDDDDDRHTERGGRQEEDEYALLNGTDTDQGRHPGRPLSWGEDRNAYGSGPGYADYRDPSDVLSPGGYEEYRREAAASTDVRPAGPAGPGGSGYSFAK